MPQIQFQAHSAILLCSLCTGKSQPFLLPALHVLFHAGSFRANVQPIHGLYEVLSL